MTKENQIEKMKEGRKKFIEENIGLVCRINKDIEIWADKYQYILKYNGEDNSYFPTIDMCLVDALQRDMKKHLIKNKKKDVEGVLKALREFDYKILELLEPLNNRMRIDTGMTKSLDMELDNIAKNKQQK